MLQLKWTSLRIGILIVNRRQPTSCLREYIFSCAKWNILRYSFLFVFHSIELVTRLRLPWNKKTQCTEWTPNRPKQSCAHFHGYFSTAYVHTNVLYMYAPFKTDRLTTIKLAFIIIFITVSTYSINRWGIFFSLCTFVFLFMFVHIRNTLVFI